MAPHSLFRRLAPVAALVVLAACGSDGPEVDLSDAGQRGFEIFRSNGCAACHGSNGEGGVGPTFVGLFGSERELEDTTETVTADRDYLARAISDPQADKVAGFRILMPTNNLSETEIESVIDYITELADVAEDS